jgi:hypothetical protein
VKVTPLDSFRMRVYMATLGLSLTLDAGKFESVEVNSKTGMVRVGLIAATPSTPVARLRIEQPAKLKNVGLYAPVKSLNMERGAYVVPLQGATTWVELVAK